MGVDVTHYNRIYDNFTRYCPMWAERMKQCIPRHTHGIRVILDNGDYVDYDDLTGSYRYHAKGVISKVDDRSDDEYQTIFATNLSDIMRARGIGQAALAKRTGLSQAMIGRYLAKSATPSWINVKRIADALECATYELTEW